MQKNTKPAFSEEVLADLKLKYPFGLKIVEITPDEDEAPLTYVVKKPSKQLIFMLSSKQYENNVEASGEALIANCVLAGNMEALNEDASVFMAMVEELSKLSKSARVALKKA